MNRLGKEARTSADAEEGFSADTGALLGSSEADCVESHVSIQSATANLSKLYLTDDDEAVLGES
jgi:hypothetical protein